MRHERRQTTAVVLADVPERVELRRLKAGLERRRDDIAELDLEIETLRERLATFEAAHHSRLAHEHQTLNRVDSFVRHLERWSKLLERPDREQIPEAAKRLQRRRRVDLGKRPVRNAQTRDGERQSSTPAEPPDPSPTTRRLKEAYRALARRYHPDLARTEDERVRHSGLMTRINALYRTGDLQRLEALAEQARGGEVEDPELAVDEQLNLLAERLAWFEAVLDNLREERAELERTPTCMLWRDIQQAETSGRDIYGELREQLLIRIRRSYRDVRNAVETLEKRVADYNRHPTPARRARAALATFDPITEQQLARIALDELDAASDGPEVQPWVTWVEQCADESPRLLQLILLTWVANLSPLPLKGLERFADLELRMNALSADDEPRHSLAELLVEGDDLVDLGVKEATETLAHTGLRFRQPLLQRAVPVALRSLSVRRLFGEVLTVLGEREPCHSCDDEVFAIPLFRLRGLDDLHATVCPNCGNALSRYWMPRGKSIQMLLNPAYLDHEIVFEYRFRLGRTTVGTQLVLAEVERATLGDLKKRLHSDLFARHDLPLRRGQLRLFAGESRQAERTPLTDLDHQELTVRFAPSAQLNEAEAVEMLRHRIRNRFRA